MRVAAFVAFVFLASPLAAQSASSHFALGIAAYDGRDPAAAAAQFRAALADDPLAYEPNWRLALALVDIGKQIPDSVKSRARDSLYALAERHAGRAVAADPTGADGHFALALAIGRGSLSKSTEERIRRATEIRTEALAAIELDPKHDGAFHVLGRWNAEIMRLSGLSRFFARRFLGAGIFKYASWQAAIDNLERAVQLDPTRIYHHLDLAQVYIDRKRFSDARSELEKVNALPLRDVLDSAYKADAAAMLAKIADEQ
jgi:tetratricopeptide (TPR) repeat protein